MPKSERVGHFRAYEQRKFKGDDQKLLIQADSILQEYESQGFAITLRSLHYQFVSRDLYENTAQNYNKLGDLMSAGRRAGLISWTAIEDMERPLRGPTTFDEPVDAIKSAREEFKTDLWCNQQWRPEVWIEKNALIGVIEPVCKELRVNYLSCKGYGSDSALWEAGQRFASCVQKGQRPIIFHLGDHDPSGVDMTRDIYDRVTMFTGIPVQVVRIALNMDQVRKYDPPENYVKLGDSRTEKYKARFGTDNCWELDALSPTVIADLIRVAVSEVCDETHWDLALQEEARHLETIDTWIEQFELGI